MNLSGMLYGIAFDIFLGTKTFIINEMSEVHETPLTLSIHESNKKTSKVHPMAKFRR